MAVKSLVNMLTSAQGYVANTLAGDHASFKSKQIYARASFVGFIPASIAAISIETVLGMLLGVGSVITIGKHSDVYKTSKFHLKCSNILISLPYYNFLCAINPTAELTTTKKGQDAVVKKQGLITESTRKAFKNFAKGNAQSTNWFPKQVTSRLTYATLLVACVVTRAVDGVIGLGAAAASILLLGTSKTLNTVAYKALQTPGIIYDIYYCGIKFINPGASKN
jgi:hypothetical protein